MSAADDPPLRLGAAGLSRRGFAVGSLGGLAAALAAGPAAGEEAAPRPLIDYVSARDPVTRFEPLGDGVIDGSRWRTGRLVSQSWRGFEWKHELSLVMPDRAAAASNMLLWIDGGSHGRLPEVGLREPTVAVRTLAAVAAAAGLPAAVVRQVPYQPMFDGLVEDGLIAHSFVEYARTGDASWPLLLPMVKAATEAMTAAAGVAREQWGMGVEGFVVAGASKRGWTTWLSAAVDRRVTGIVPMVIDMLALDRHLRLQIDSFGGLSEQLDDYTSRGVEKLLSTPRGRELIGIVDPYVYRDRLAMPKVIALGTNDPYWPLESLDLYYDGLPGPRWVSYCPNAGHDLPEPRVAGLVAAMGRHAAGLERLPDLRWRFENVGPRTMCVAESAVAPECVVFWTARSATRDFRKAVWKGVAVAGAGPTWRVPVEPPDRGFAAALVELHYPREPLPLVLTSGVKVLHAA